MFTSTHSSDKSHKFSGIRFFGLVLTLALLAACGGDSDSGSVCVGDQCEAQPIAVQVGVVKGPLTGVAWEFTSADGESFSSSSGGDTSNFLFGLEDGTGASLITIDGMNETVLPILLEIDASGTGVTSSDGTPPTLTELRTLITEEMVRSGEPIIVTPLSTLATDLLLDGRAYTDLTPGEIAGIENDMNQVSAQVIAVFGFGAADGANVFTTPSAFVLPDQGIVSGAELQTMGGLRKANEAFALALDGGSTNAVGVANADGMLANVVLAFVDDRVIDGAGADGGIAGIPEFIAAAAAIMEADVSNIDTDIFAAAELVFTGQSVDPDADQQSLFNNLSAIGLGIPAITGSQVTVDFSQGSDGDGDPDSADPFPFDPSADSTNASGIADDGNGILDLADVPNAAADLDGDTVADLIDNCSSIDNSTFGSDVNPNQQDSDGDGVGDTCDSNPGDSSSFDDADLDGINTAFDNCPDIANGVNEAFPIDIGIDDDGIGNQTDTDGDGAGDACDDDDDNDGVDDGPDNAPRIASATVDADGDGIDDIGGLSPNGTELSGPDNCPGLNPGQEDLDLSLIHI